MPVTLFFNKIKSMKILMRSGLWLDDIGLI